MHERLQERLDELQREFAAGQNALADLGAKQSDLQQTLLRISGAIQVLTELLDIDTASDHHLADATSPERGTV